MKTRIKDKEHLEQIFRKYTKLHYDEELSDKFVFQSGLTFGELKKICECIGYHNILLETDFLRMLEAGIEFLFDTIYIDLIGIKEVNFSGDKKYINFFNKLFDELEICEDGTLRILF